MTKGVAPVIRAACLFLILFFAMSAFAVPTVTAADQEADQKLVVRGKALFTGAQPLAKGGAPCAACHAFRALGITGGNLASDLTDLYEGMGEEGLTGVLTSLDFPLMKKIYADRPLADEEIASLTILTRAAAAAPKERTSLLFPLAGVGVFICCLAILMLYRRRIG